MNNSNGNGTPFDQLSKYIQEYTNKIVEKVKRWENQLSREEKIVVTALVIFACLMFFKIFTKNIGFFMIFIVFIVFLAIKNITAKIQQQTLDIINNELVPTLKKLGYNNPIVEVDKYIKDDTNFYHLGLAPSYDYCYENLRILTDEFVYTNFYTTKLVKRYKDDNEYYEEIENFAGIILGVNVNHYFKTPVRILQTGINGDIGHFKGKSATNKEVIIDTNDEEFDSFFEVFASNMNDAQDALQFYILDALKSYVKNYGHFNVCFYKNFLLFSFNNSRGVDNYNIPDFQLACKKNGYNSNYNLNVLDKLNDVLYEINMINSLIN